MKEIQEVKEKIFLEKNLYIYTYIFRASLLPLVVKNLIANASDLREAGLIPGQARPPGGGHGNPL